TLGKHSISPFLQRMETSFGESFENVAIDRSPEASRTAASLNAIAVTSGEAILLGPDAPSLESDSGRHLLAHELAHVAQQRRASSLDRNAVGAAGGAFETSADRAADAAVQGRPASVSAGTGVPGVQRQVKTSPNCDRNEAERMIKAFLE